jgi:DNA-binding MarR family transcriptional regulator
MSIKAIEYTDIQQAKDMILTLFKEKGTLDYLEILEALDLDLETIVKVCDELEQEGRIEGMD